MQRDAEQERSTQEPGQALLDSGLLLAQPKEIPEAFHRKLLTWLVVDDPSKEDRTEGDDPS